MKECKELNVQLGNDFKSKEKRMNIHRRSWRTIEPQIFLMWRTDWIVYHWKNHKLY